MPVSVALVGAIAHRVVDGLRGGLVLELDGEVDERAGGQRDAHREALQATRGARG